MKKLIFFPVLFLCCLCKGQTSYKDSIIGTPIIIGNLVVAQYELPYGASWDQAKKECKLLGKGWRLPNKEELNLIFKNRDKIGFYFSELYWSSTEVNSKEALCQDFGPSGDTLIIEKWGSYGVRAVKTVNRKNKVKKDFNTNKKSLSN
jgi:hypothetical protein